MPSTSRIFRVFISSTFSDFKQERNALQEQVFPQLRAICEEYGCRFQAIDLRGGVSEEAGLDQQTMHLCLQEIERCQLISPRPNFIVLLGNRYGWQPLPYEIPLSEFEAFSSFLTPDQLALFEQWYKRDDNAVPPVFDLLPREGIHEEHLVWQSIEQELQSFLRSAVDKAALLEEARIKYFCSATEQEIVCGALNVPNSNDHVFTFFRNFDQMPETEDARDFVDFASYGKLDSNASLRLQILKDKLRKQLKDNVHEYTAEWLEGNCSSNHLSQLCDDVFFKLSSIIREELKGLQQIDALTQEIEAHSTFAKGRTQFFVGRIDVLDAIGAYLICTSNVPLGILGEGGSGKSSLMAYAAESAQKNLPTALIISRFIGVTPSSSDIWSLLNGLISQIRTVYGRIDESTNPTDFKALVESFYKHLSLAEPDKPLILFLDAIDQLTDSFDAKGLTWLRAELPNNVRIVASALDSGVYADILARNLPHKNIIQLHKRKTITQ